MIGFIGSTREIVSQSAEWWREHGFDSLSESLAAEDFDHHSDGSGGAFVFPPLAQQQEFAATIAALGAYSEPARIDFDLALSVADRPTGPYLLELAPSIPDWSRGLTASGLRAALAERSLSGLTVFEYLVLQRRAYQVHGDHRFDDYVGTPPGWTWLSASTSGPLVAMAYYYAATGRVEISACKAGSKNPRKGSHVVTVVPA